MSVQNCLPISDVLANLQITGAATRYEALDDPVGTPDDDTTFVHVPQGVANYCICGFTHTVPAGSLISSIDVFVRTYVDGSNGSTAAQSAYLRVHENDYHQDGCGATGAYGNTTKTWATNPYTGLAWTYADLADIQGFGPGLATDGAAGTRSKCTQSYLIITYTVGTTRTISDAGGNSNAATAWVEGIVPTSNDDIVATPTSGNLVINANLSCKSVDLTGYTGRITHNASINLDVNGNFKLSSGMTYAPASITSTISFKESSLLTTYGKLMPTMSFSKVGGTFQLQDDLLTYGRMELGAGIFDANGKKVTLQPAGYSIIVGGTGFVFYDLEIIGAATPTAYTYFSNDFTITHSLIITGNSTINRILIQSNVLGIQRTVTNAGATVTATNTDFRDIRFGTAVDLSAAAGGSGDCGGNANIIFTATTDQTWNGDSGNWSNTAKWTSRIPLPQDNVILDGTNTITADMPRIGKDISFTAATPLTLANNVTTYGSISFANAGTFTHANKNWYFESQARTGTLSLTSNNMTFAQINIQTIGATFQLQDDFTSISILNITEVVTWSGNNKNVTVSKIYINKYAAIIWLGSGTYTLTGTGQVLWVANSNFHADTSNFVISDTSNSAKTFDGDIGHTFYNIFITGGGTGSVTFTTSNTFNNFTISGPKTVMFTKNTTTNINGTFTTNGTSVNHITITSNLLHNKATLSKPNGAVICDYLALTDIEALGGATWFAGSHSTDNGGNTGWLWQDPVKPQGMNVLYGAPFGGRMIA